MLLLPRLDPGVVVCVGTPSVAVLAALAARARSVRLACPHDADRERALRRAAEVGAPNVGALAPDELLERGEHADLAVVPGWRAFTTACADEAMRAALVTATATFVGLDGPGWPAGAPARARRATAELGRGAVLRLAPGAGAVRTIAADDDAATLEFVERIALPDRGRRARRLVSGGSRRALLVVPGEEGRRLATPAYVRRIARAAGEGADGRIGLSAPREGAAQLYVFAATQARPRYVVKIAREASDNAALHNEWRALRRLRDTHLAHVDDLPHPAFFDHHAGLAVLGMSAIDGVPFHRRTTARADCALARAAVQWLLELAAATVTLPDDNRQLAARLREVQERFLELYRLTPGQRDRLAAHVEEIATAQPPLPLVLAHGDPTTANLVVTESGRPAFMDWEAADLQGPPLWDLFRFVRSFGLTVARAVGVADPLAGVRRQLLGDLPVNRLLLDAVGRQCLELGIDRSLVGALFVTCWMERAVAEAPLLRADHRERGHYGRLVRACLDEAGGPGLRRLLATEVELAGS